MSTPFSLLLPVYHQDTPEQFLRAFTSSVTDQTRRPDQVVVVQDGPVDDGLAAMIREVVKASPVHVDLVVLDSIGGLSNALTAGLAACRNDVVARMDADDISLPERFHRQLEVIEQGFDLVGAAMLEFDQSGAIVGTRRPPSRAGDITKLARFHDPFNHPSVVYRRSAVAKAGGYRDLPLMEDYWLFARMIASGAAVSNVDEPLVLYRVTTGAYVKRGGLALLRSEVRLQNQLYSEDFISRREYLRNLLVRGSYRLFPRWLRRIGYHWLIARKLSG